MKRGTDNKGKLRRYRLIPEKSPAPKGRRARMLAGSDAETAEATPDSAATASSKEALVPEEKAPLLAEKPGQERPAPPFADKALSQRPAKKARHTAYTAKDDESQALENNLPQKTKIVLGPAEGTERTPKKSVNVENSAIAAARRARENAQRAAERASFAARRALVRAAATRAGKNAIAALAWPFAAGGRAVAPLLRATGPLLLGALRSIVRGYEAIDDAIAAGLLRTYRQFCRLGAAAMEAAPFLRIPVWLVFGAFAGIGLVLTIALHQFRHALAVLATKANDSLVMPRAAAYGYAAVVGIALLFVTGSTIASLPPPQSQASQPQLPMAMNASLDIVPEGDDLDGMEEAPVSYAEANVEDVAPLLETGGERKPTTPAVAETEIEGPVEHAAMADRERLRLVAERLEEQRLAQEAQRFRDDEARLLSGKSRLRPRPNAIPPRQRVAVRETAAPAANDPAMGRSPGAASDQLSSGRRLEGTSVRREIAGTARRAEIAGSPRRSRLSGEYRTAALNSNTANNRTLEGTTRTRRMESEVRPETRTAVRSLPPADIVSPKNGGKARIAIVIDDMGMVQRIVPDLAALKGPLNFAFLPYAPRLEEQTAMVRRGGHELLVHLPMQPKRRTADPGPQALLTSMSDDDLAAHIRWNLDRFDGYVGINNHMGSEFTENVLAMRAVIRELKARNLYFLDSVTSSATVGYRVAEELGVARARRDIFLDNERDRHYIARQFRALERRAYARGYAIAIGHPHRETYEVLRAWLRTLGSKQIELVKVSSLVQQSPVQMRTAEQQGRASSAGADSGLK